MVRFGAEPKVPAGHGVHAVVDPAEEYVPAGHAMQLTGPPVCAQELSVVLRDQVSDGPAKPGRHVQV